MTTINRTIETEQDRTMAARLIEARSIPFTFTLTDGKHRTTAQNKLQRLWMNEIAQQKGDTTPEEARAYCKLTIGVPILRAQNEAFRIRYDEVVKPLPYEQKIAIMSEPLDLPVTRIMTTKQKTEYLDGIIRHFAEQGIVLTMPEQPSDAPASDEGSDDASPPGIVAADPSLSQESGPADGGTEAPEEPAALPSAEQSMVNSGRQMNTEAIKAEMVRKLLQLAGDTALTVQERMENLDGMKPLWTEHLTGFPLVVTQAFQTAAKIIKGELKPEAGKKFMEGLI